MLESLFLLIRERPVESEVELDLGDRARGAHPGQKVVADRFLEDRPAERERPLPEQILGAGGFDRETQDRVSGHRAIVSGVPPARGTPGTDGEPGSPGRSPWATRAELRLRRARPL